MEKDLETCSIYCDLDGVLVHHHMNENNDGVPDQVYKEQKALPGADKINEWRSRGARVIITTARKMEYRQVTEQLLDSLGIGYDFLLMQVGSGNRYLINDIKPNKGTDSAFAINLTRNVGLKDVVI